MKIRFMSIVLLLLLLAVMGNAAPASGSTPFEGQAARILQNPIDQHVFGQLERLGIQPAHLCSDAVFLRRAYLDIIGTLPTATEASAFLLNRDANKRRALIDQLLAREEFADYWAMKWSDLLRVKAEFPINLWPNAAQAYHRWIRTSIKENLPYDQFVRELLTASGSNFRVGQVNFYRALQNKEPPGIAQAVALTFLGTRAEKWPREQWSNFAVFFSKVGYKPTAEWKEEIVYFDPGKTNAGMAAGDSSRVIFPDGTSARLSPDKDPRVIFADWLISPTNPWFARNLANRMWYWLLGRGVIHEPDDLRPDNPPCNPDLVSYLEQEFIKAHYDLKHLFRLILNSKTYQLSSLPKAKTPEAEANFAHYPLRRLEAEVLIDAINQITRTSEKYTSPIPEPFTFIPENQRSIALADGSITSPFLELFGRPPRDTGLESERNPRFTASQRLHLLNSSHIQRKLEQSRMVQLQLQNKNNPRALVTGIYLGTLSRFPTPEELQTVTAYYQSGKVSPREATVDLAWALINSAEFLYKH